MMTLDELFTAADAACEVGDYTIALRLFLEGAGRGDAEAMTRVAAMYDDGEGVPRDLVASMAWSHKAIEAGSTSAMYNLAVTYRRLGDICAARDWFERTLAAGDASAALQLAKLYSVSDKEHETVVGYLRQALASDDLSPDDREEAQAMLDGSQA